MAEDAIAFASNLLAKEIEDSPWWGQDRLKIIMLNLVAQYFPQHERTWDLITQRARDDPDSWVRQKALELLATGRKEVPAT